MPYVKSHYEGGHRAVIDGVPVRLARKPGKTSLALMRQSNKPFSGRAVLSKYLTDWND